MASEKSFQDRLQHSHELAAAVALLDPAYAPADAKFTLDALRAAIATAEMANANVEAQRIPYQDATADRIALAMTIGPLATQALAYVKSNTAWEQRHDAVKSAADKVRGVRTAAAKPADPDQDARRRARGEHSYVEIAGHLKSYTDRLAGLNGYAPPDPKIATDAFSNLWSTLDSYNKIIPSASRVLADAIRERLESFIGPAALKAVFDGVKLSVKGQYGQNSPQYQAISGMSW